MSLLYILYSFGVVSFDFGILLAYTVAEKARNKMLGLPRQYVILSLKIGVVLGFLVEGFMGFNSQIYIPYLLVFVVLAALTMRSPLLQKSLGMVLISSLGGVYLFSFIKYALNLSDPYVIKRLAVIVALAQIVIYALVHYMVQRTQRYVSNPSSRW